MVLHSRDGRRGGTRNPISDRATRNTNSGSSLGDDTLDPDRWPPVWVPNQYVAKSSRIQETRVMDSGRYRQNRPSNSSTALLLVVPEVHDVSFPYPEAPHLPLALLNCVDVP